MYTIAGDLVCYDLNARIMKRRATSYRNAMFFTVWANKKELDVKCYDSD